MAKNQRGRNNNNPEGRNQYSSDVMSAVKDHPLATAAAVAGAVGAGVFLWSNRERVGNQVNRISRTAGEMGRRAGRKASDWMDEMRSQKSDGGFASQEQTGSGISRPIGKRSSASQANGGRSRSASGQSGQSMTTTTTGAATAG